MEVSGATTATKRGVYETKLVSHEIDLQLIYSFYSKLISPVVLVVGAAHAVVATLVAAGVTSDAAQTLAAVCCAASTGLTTCCD